MFLSYILFPVFIALSFAAVQWYVKRHIRYKSLKKIPGSTPTFLIGNLSWIIKLYSGARNLMHSPAVYVAERINGYGMLHQKVGMYVFWFGLEPIVSIQRAEIFEKILGSSTSIEKSYEYGFLHKWLGTGLLTSKGEKWKLRRKLLTPSFHFRILEDFLPIFHQQSMALVEKLKSMADQDYIDISPPTVLCTLDIICETAMGVSIRAQKGDNSDYVKAIHNLADFFNKRSVYPWLWKDFLFGLTSMGRSFNRDIATMHNFTNKVIREKKEKLLSGENLSKEAEESEFYSKKRRTFMDTLLDMHINGQQLSESDIREEVDTFMFEGHDTTAVGITFALYLIGLYPQVQKKVIEEIDEIFGDDIERPVTYDDTRNMKYLECILKESQRLFPSVPIIGRKTDETIDFEGLTIPKNTTVHCPIITLHRNPRDFPNPEVFDPDRFLPENSLTRHPYAYVPFSAGPRNCIGQKFAILEEKTVICNILRHFNFVSLDPRDKFHIKIEFVLRPAQAVRLKFKPRR